MNICDAALAAAPSLWSMAKSSGSLHRYLAEALWAPTALLPQSGVVWTPLSDRTALATLTDRGTTVSLEFQFNEIGEVGWYVDGELQVVWKGDLVDVRYELGP